MFDMRCKDTRRALLGAHPEVQQRVATEMAAAGLMATTAKPEPRRLSYADLACLPFLDAVRHAHAQLRDGCWLHRSMVLQEQHADALRA